VKRRGGSSVSRRTAASRPRARAAAKGTVLLVLQGVHERHPRTRRSMAIRIPSTPASSPGITEAACDIVPTGSMTDHLGGLHGPHAVAPAD
jgi:hypothetical protein